MAPNARAPIPSETGSILPNALNRAAIPLPKPFIKVINVLVMILAIFCIILPTPSTNVLKTSKADFSTLPIPSTKALMVSNIPVTIPFSPPPNPWPIFSRNPGLLTSISLSSSGIDVPS